MKRVMLAVMSGLLLSCQGPAAVLAQDTTTPVLDRLDGSARHLKAKRVTKATRRPSMVSDEPGAAATRADLCAPRVAARPNPPFSGNSLSTVQSVNLPLDCA